MMIGSATSFAWAATKCQATARCSTSSKSPTSWRTCTPCKTVHVDAGCSCGKVTVLGRHMRVLRKEEASPKLGFGALKSKRRDSNPDTGVSRVTSQCIVKQRILFACQHGVARRVFGY